MLLQIHDTLDEDVFVVRPDASKKERSQQCQESFIFRVLTFCYIKYID